MKSVAEYLVELMDDLELEISTAFSPDSGAQNTKNMYEHSQCKKPQILADLKRED